MARHRPDPSFPEQFEREIANHQLTVLRDDGLYRHVRFSQPESSTYRFDLITWPGYLAYVGDMGDYVFSRLPDMFAFFRGSALQDRPNISYWAEKVCAEDRQSAVTKFSEDHFREVVAEDFERFWESHGASDEAKAELWEEVEDTVLSALDNDGKDAAFAAARDMRHDGRDVFSDLWDHDFTEYTHRFIWCCHAIVRAIRAYDAARDEVAARAGRCDREHA